MDAGAENDSRRWNPSWLVCLVCEHEGTDLQFIMAKELEKTDLSKHHCRLLLRKACVEKKLLAVLNSDEVLAANLNLPPLSKKRKVSTPREDAPPLQLAAEESKMEGLSVKVFFRNRWRLEMKLKRWDGSGGTVIKGREWALARSFCEFEVGDTVVLWAFRRGLEKELCLVMANKRTMYL